MIMAKKPLMRKNIKDFYKDIIIEKKKSQQIIIIDA